MPRSVEPEPREPTPPVGLGALLGNPAVRAALDRAVRRAGLPHALLLSGPRGVGKRTVARALAAQQFCETREACGSCAPCRAWEHGNQVGLVELGLEEGKSRISIAQVKELSRVLSLAAEGERGRVVLLHPADRMSDAAQDALLKTLEEPPPGNLLVLIAERLDAVFPTIRSRCQRYALAPLDEASMQVLAERQGLELRLPLATAVGCPGRLEELADERLDELRRGVLWILKAPRGPEDAARWAYVLHRGMPDKAEPEAFRERARQLWTLLGHLVRDVVVLASVELSSDASGPTIRNPDLRDELTGLTERPEYADPAELLEALARARQRIDGAIDPAFALYGVFHGAAAPGLWERVRAGHA